MIYLAVDYRQGIGLAQQGYDAMALKRYDAAITDFDAALKTHLGWYQRSVVYLNRAAALNFKYRLDEAIRDHTEALRLNPKLFSAYAGRGWAYQQKGEIDKAIADFDQAIQQDPNSGSAYYNRGSIFYGKKEIDRALADFDEAVRCRQEANGFAMRGLCYMAKNDLDRALANFDAAIAIDPDNVGALSGRGRVYQAKGQYAKSANDLAAARRLGRRSQKLWTSNQRPKPDGLLERSARLQVKPLPLAEAKGSLKPSQSYSGLFLQAQQAYRAGDFDRAIDLNNAALALEISPEEASVAVMNRGNAYGAKGESERALRDYNEAITLNPKNAGAYVDRALILSQRGEFEDADKDYREGLRLNPNQWQAYFNRATDDRDQGRLEEAIEDLNNVTKLNPQFAAAYASRGAIRMQKGEIDQAIKDYNRAIKLDPHSVNAYTGRAGAYARKKEYAKAISDLEKLARLNPKKPDVALNSLAWFRATCPEARVRDGSKAIAAATKACELTDWKEWGYIDTLAAAYAEAGKFEKAIKYQKQALKMVSNDQGGVVQEAKDRLALYQQHHPYREEPKN